VIKAVIFDVDGTLVDSVDVHARSWVGAFRDYGVDVEFAVMRRQIGKGGDQIIRMFLSQQQVEEFGGRLEQHRGRLLRDRYMPEIKAIPGCRPLLEHLLRDGKKIALASSAKEDELAKYKQIAGIEDLINAETSSDDAEKSKPDPDIFQAALKRLGMNPDECLAVGDTPYDAEAAGKIGLRTIGVLSGGWTEHDLRQAGCIAVYRDVAHLLDHYDKSPIATR
jgi:HAD superfamily hydrolase (TIGR01509 family)